VDPGPVGKPGQVARQEIGPSVLERAETVADHLSHQDEDEGQDDQQRGKQHRLEHEAPGIDPAAADCPLGCRTRRVERDGGARHQ
jgi:hypothetical protein